MLSFNLLLSISCFPSNYPRSFWFMIIFSKSLKVLFLAVSCKNVTLTSKLLKLLNGTWLTINPFPFWQRHIDNSFWDLLLKFVVHEPVHLLWRHPWCKLHLYQHLSSFFRSQAIWIIPKTLHILNIQTRIIPILTVFYQRKNFEKIKHNLLLPNQV